MKIDFLIGDNAYGTTVHFAKGLSTALESLGVKTRLFWIADGHFYQAFYAICDDPPDFTCSFSDISLGGQPLGELWSIPHISLLVDPPLYFLHQLRGENTWVTCVDENDCHFVQQLGCQRALMLPHGVDIELKTPVEKERPYDVVFFGSCIDYESIEKAWPKNERDLLKAASQRVLSADGVSILQALMELNVPQADYVRLHTEVDRYTRGKDRVELINSLKDHTVHVWGEGPWEHYVPDAMTHPPISFSDTIQVMQQSRVVLNSSPRFKAGSHERIYYALMCGASVYTGETAYLKSQLPELFTYRFGGWAPTHFDEWEKRAASGQQKVIAEHTYHSRAKALLHHLR